MSVKNIDFHLLPELKEKTSGKIFIYDELESTNITAKKMILAYIDDKINHINLTNSDNHPLHGTVIIADRQTAGKGRYGRKFHSPPGCGIYISFILDPKVLFFSNPTLITAFAAVAVCSAAEAISGKPLDIKWVNDILLDGKKICGILTESVNLEKSKSGQLIILGIGINFVTEEAGFPKELQHTAGSLFELEELADINASLNKKNSGKKSPVTRNHLIAELINRIINKKNTIDEKNMIEKYKEKMYLFGKQVIVRNIHPSDSFEVTSYNKDYEATVVDIDNQGRLIVKNKDGSVSVLSSGEVSIK